VKVISDCPHHFDIRYGDAVKSSAPRPTTNIPVICILCSLAENSAGLLIAHWKYNIERHIWIHHPEYAVPGVTVPPRGGKPLPPDFAAAISFAAQEEERVGVSTTTSWAEIGIRDPAEIVAVHPAVSSTAAATARPRPAAASTQPRKKRRVENAFV
jgi:hypothetical protein